MARIHIYDSQLRCGYLMDIIGSRYTVIRKYRSDLGKLIHYYLPNKKKIAIMIYEEINVFVIRFMVHNIELYIAYDSAFPRSSKK